MHCYSREIHRNCHIIDLIICIVLFPAKWVPFNNPCRLKGSNLILKVMSAKISSWSLLVWRDVNENLPCGCSMWSFIQLMTPNPLHSKNQPESQVIGGDWRSKRTRNEKQFQTHLFRRLPMVLRTRYIIYLFHFCESIAQRVSTWSLKVVDTWIPYKPNVGKYTLHGSYGSVNRYVSKKCELFFGSLPTQFFLFAPAMFLWPFVTFNLNKPFKQMCRY